MKTSRLEAFSDGVIAILITIMVLELRVPQGADWAALRPAIPKFMAYVLSFTFLGIYWNNHHHMLHAAERVNGRIMWANLHLLFWLSLMPVTTAWWGESRFAPLPTAVYGVDLVLAGVGYVVLQTAIVAHHGPDSRLAEAIGGDFKGKLSLASYLIAIPLAFWYPYVSSGIYLFVACMWLIPDPRIESRLK